MEKISSISRYLLGILLLVFGLNGFLQFLPMPPVPEQAMAFLSGLMAAPYFFPLLKGVEVIAGVLLLLNKKVPLTLVILAPIVLNIFLFHAVLDPAGGAGAYLTTGLFIAVTYGYWDTYKEVLQA